MFHSFFRGVGTRVGDKLSGMQNDTEKMKAEDLRFSEFETHVGVNRNQMADVTVALQEATSSKMLGSKRSQARNLRNAIQRRCGERDTIQREGFLCLRPYSDFGRIGDNVACSVQSLHEVKASAEIQERVQTFESSLPNMSGIVAHCDLTSYGGLWNYALGACMLEKQCWAVRCLQRAWHCFWMKLVADRGLLLQQSVAATIVQLCWRCATRRKGQHSHHEEDCVLQQHAV